MMVVTIETEPTLNPGNPEVLFEAAPQHHLAELRTLAIGQVQEFDADSVRQTVSYDSHADDVVDQRRPQPEFVELPGGSETAQDR